MKIRFTKQAVLAIGLVLGGFLVLAYLDKSHHPQTPAPEPENAQPLPAGAVAGEPAQTNAEPTAPPVVAPFIIKDTDNDSPGTNIVTRIVTFTAEIGGTPPPLLQWKVDHGSGYEVIAGATHATFRIGNAQVSDTGSYSLFATNSAGGIHTTPQPIAIIEGVD